MGKDGLKEADLCSDLKAWATARGWTVYPEVESYDQVLVPAAEQWEGIGAAAWPHWKDKDVLALHAKLQGNVEVLYQAVSCEDAPWKMVVVRRPSEAFLGLAEHLGLGVLAMDTWVPAYWSRPGRWERAPLGWQVHARGMRRHEVRRRLELPEVVADLPAGVPGPKQLTPWRAKALRMCARIRLEGAVSTADFKAVGLDPRRWIDLGWLLVSGTVMGPSGRKVQRLVEGPAGLPDKGWEAVRDQLVAVSQPTTASAPEQQAIKSFQ